MSTETTPSVDNPYNPPDRAAQGGGSPSLPHEWYRPARWSATLSIVALGLTVAANGVALLALMAAGPRSQSLFIFVAAVLIARLLILVAAVPFLVWFYVSYRNLSALWVGGLRYSTAWALGGWFIPVFNFWRPYQVATELWDASNPDVPLSEGPTGWIRRQSAHLVQIWWVLNLAAYFVFGFASRNMRSWVSGQAPEGTPIIAVGLLLYMGAAVAAIHVVRRLSHRQEERYAQLTEAAKSRALAHLQPEKVDASVNESPSAGHDPAVSDHLRRKRRRARTRR